MIFQVLDRSGNAIARKAFNSLVKAERWINENYPMLDECGYSLEILYQ